MSENMTVTVLGAGVIGASWAALFASHGHAVRVYDPAPDARARIDAMAASAAPILSALGAPLAGELGGITLFTDPVEAVQGAQIIQENIPERLELKHALYARIEPHLLPGAILATSTSGLKLSALQAGLSDPSRLVLGHPFNPPHLVPLVETMENAATAPGVLARLQAFYESLGKTCIRVNKEVTGHVVNRLQAAIWREALYLMDEGVASLGDIDRAVSAGAGLRWSVMGPSMIFNLGGGEGGIRQFCHHLGEPMHSWWAALGDIRLTPEVIEKLAAGIAEETKGRSQADLAAERDAKVLATLLAQRALDRGEA